MTHVHRLIAALFFLGAVAAHTAAAQTLANLKLPNRQSLLNGRAFLDFPAAAVNSARATDIMSADRNTNQETRIVFDRGAMRLVFFAHELYAVGDKSALVRTVEAQNSKSKAVTATVADEDGLVALLSTPTSFDATQAAILVNSLLVKTADNSLFQIDAYLNPEAYKKRPEFAALTARIFRSVAAGPRAVNRQARVETLPIFDSAKKFRIRLPANYAITVDQKYDFQVFKFHKYTPIGSSAEGSFLLYVGSHPSFLYRGYDLNQEQAKAVAGQFLGQPIQWLTFQDEARKLFIREQQVSGGAIAERLVLHVGMVGHTPTALDEFTQIAAAIRLVD